MRLIFAVIISLTILIFHDCSRDKKEVREPISSELQEDSLVKIQDSINFLGERKRLDSVATLTRVKAEKEIQVLKKSFTIIKDEFSGIEHFQHANFGGHWPNRKTIYLRGGSDGSYVLVSNFYGDDWLFHEQIKVKFEDGTILESEKVSTLDEGNRQQNDGGEVWENVIYAFADEIIKRIANNPKQKVIVRFIGRQYYDEVTLTLTDKTMIAQTYRLAELYMTVKTSY